MIQDKIVSLKNKRIKFHIERFESSMELAKANRERTKTSSRFYDIEGGDWQGCVSMEEALDLLTHGYQGAVDQMKEVYKPSNTAVAKRIKFENSVAGFAPVVPLALMGVPNSMINMRQVPMKQKVLDLYVDMTAASYREAAEFIKAGKEIMSAIVALEKQGYRLNLYSCQTYYESRGGSGNADMLVMKVKSASQPLDLKRCSFSVAHPAFFRMIGFDWYSKVPGGRFRDGYGRPPYYEYRDEGFKQIGTQLFGKNAILLSYAAIMDENDMGKEASNYIKEACCNEKGR